MDERTLDGTHSLPGLHDGTVRLQVHAWTVEVVGGPDKGRKVTSLEGIIRVGSDATSDLALSDGTVSRRHLELVKTARGLLLRDLGSRNGTFLDGRQVLEAYVQPGDKLELGKTRLALRQERPTEVEASSAEQFGELVGSSERMRTVFAELRRLAREDVPLVLEGETGTGKEVAARAVHAHSQRRHGPFRVVDCPLLTEQTAMAELFGTSGEEDSGAFSQAKGGTLFLDEVAALPPGVQVRLLRVLETGQVQLPGEARPRQVDVRVVAATQANLDEEVRSGRVRADLFFRLAVARVRLPPLRTRKEDLPVLARELTRRLLTPLELPPQTLSLFEGYDWPGNVRELRNVLERGALQQQTGSASWVELLVAPARGPGAEAGGRGPVEGLIGLPYHEAKDRVLADFERLYFAEMMRLSNFDMAVAEKKTGLSMQSLYRLLKKNGLRMRELKNVEGL